MAQRYAVMESGAWTGAIIPRPASYNNTALVANASDDIFRSLGLWPVVVDDPGPSNEWEERAGIQHTVNTTDKTVTETVQYALIEVNQRQVTMRQQAEAQYAQTLETGFIDADGIRWQANKAARDKILDLTQRIQEFRAGNVASALPQSKTSVKLTDATGAIQDVSETKILQLAELGSDFKDAAEDRLEQLIGQIQAATSNADLDDIDITNGWPT